MRGAGRPGSRSATHAAWLGRKYDGAGRGVYRALYLLLLILLLSTPLAAQPLAPLDGRTVTAVEIEGLRQLTAETVLFYLGLVEGEPLDRTALDNGLASLWSRRLVDDVTIEAFPVGTHGVRVVVRIVERPLLVSIDYQGMKHIRRSDITDRILADNIQVLEQAPLSRGELERIKAVIEDLYREKGYRFAAASYRLEEVEPQRVAVTFTADEGSRVRIGEVGFTGNEVYGELGLQWRMKETRETNLVNRLLKKDIYNPGKLEEDLARIREAYRKKGYKNAGVGEPEIEVTVQRPEAPTPKAQKRRIEITIPIEEGRRWRLGTTTIEGNETFPDTQLLRAFEIEEGEWLRSKKLDEAIQALDDVYQNNGFLYARIEPEIRERTDAGASEEPVADLVVHVSEGERFTIGRIEIEGNTRTRDKVLRRELRLHEGSVMNTGALRNSIFKVNQLGYFQLDAEEPVSIDVDHEAKAVHLTFRGEEVDRTELQLGGGWNDAYGLEGQFTLRTSNLMGRGETLGVQIARGEFRDAVDLSYFVPWLLDRPQTVGIRIFDQDTFFEIDDRDLDQEVRGAQLSYGRSLGLFQSLSLSYSFTDLDQLFESLVFDQETLEERVVPVRIRQRLASVRPAWVLDSRDSRFETTRGRKIAVSVEVANDALGGDTEFVRPEVEISLFRPSNKLPLPAVFAFHAEAGMVENLGETTLTPSQRYYLGGENSIRGHRTNTLFVRDAEGRRLLDSFGFALGGDRYLQLNLEGHLLLGGPLRLLGFVDAGNVWDSGAGVDVTDLRATAGIELRLNVPMFGAPLRFIYAKNLDPIDELLDPDTGAVRVPGDDFRTFRFAIGTTF